MKRIIKSIVIILLLLLTSCGRVTEQQAREALHNNLIKRYGEEFEIGYMGRRSDGKEIWYEAEIYPSKYKGIPKEYDKYYRSTGSVDIKKGIFGEKIDYTGDLYREVLINESASKFYLTKLKELFGENVLPVFNIDVSKLAINPDYYETLKNRLAEGRSLKLKGGIYIFGRVENDEDREWYRKQIYEFVQFMKQTGTFEYVWLWVVVADERVLSDDFVNNTEDKEKLLSLHNGNETEFRKQRAEIMKKYSKSYEETPIENIRERTENILKSDLYNPNGNSIGITKLTYYNHILVSLLASKKYIKSNSLEEEYLLKDYDKIEDVEFYEEHY